MDRRAWLHRAAAGAACVASPTWWGCRGRQYGHVLSPEQANMVGSHAAGAETYSALIAESMGKLLGRQQAAICQATHAAGPPAPKRICFVCVENYSAEEVGDFREQIYEEIDGQISASGAFVPVSRRFVDAALRETRLRPDALFVPENRRAFASVLEQQGQPFDYLLYAKLTSGTTQNNQDYQRDYLLTLELIDVQTGGYDKESAKLRKGYHKTRLGKWRLYNPFA
jgi:hypothetical protein